MSSLTVEQRKFIHLRAGASARAFDAWSERQAAWSPRLAKDDEILIYGLVLSEAEAVWARMWGDESIMTGAEFREQLAKISGEAVIRFNSDGGDAFEASTIVQAIQERISDGGTVKGVIDGIAASAASIIACVCNDVTIAQMGQIMIHRAGTWMSGNAEDLRKAADFLAKLDDQVVGIYSARAKGKKNSDILEMMSEETYLSAEEAVELGFADRVFEPDAEDGAVAFARMRKDRVAVIMA